EVPVSPVAGAGILEVLALTPTISVSTTLAIQWSRAIAVPIGIEKVSTVEDNC
nr:hypothetical protein [Tanacetum cinerariifolium]